MSEIDQATAIEPGVRVSTLELFFDLVFVFTLTQLTALLANELTPTGVLQVVLMSGIILWMYGGYAWLTNAVAPTSRFRRTLMLVGMGGFLGIALAIPQAFGAAGWIFGLGYFVVNAVHSGLFIKSGGPGAARAMLRLAPLNLTTATFVLVGGLVPGVWRYVIWAAAFILLVLTPYLHPIGGFTISPTHFAERHGLVVIIALGESIVAIGVGASGLTIDLVLIAVAVLGLTLSYLMWWVYFGGDEVRAEHALSAVDPERRAMVALRAFGYAHYFILLGIVVFATGLKKAVGHTHGSLKLSEALALAGGLAVFLLGDASYRWILAIGRQRYRAVTALVALATVPLGMMLAVGQLAALIVLIVAMLYIEAYRPGGIRANP